VSGTAGAISTIEVNINGSNWTAATFTDTAFFKNQSDAQHYVSLKNGHSDSCLRNYSEQSQEAYDLCERESIPSNLLRIKMDSGWAIWSKGKLQGYIKGSYGFRAIFRIA
jgi:hypothetical protein